MSGSNCLPYRATTSSSADEKKVILAEIIGATDLQHHTDPKLSSTMHPFVIAIIHGNGPPKILCRTKRAKETCNPIWCIERRCLFLIHVSSEMSENESSYQVQFDVRDRDSIDRLACTMIGSHKLSLKEILHACEEKAEERMELKLETSSFDYSTEDHNKLAVRFRFATPLDLEFMQELERINQNAKFFPSLFNDPTQKLKDLMENATSEKLNTRPQMITEMSQREMGYRVVSMMTDMYSKKTSKGRDGVRRTRVQPGPDPARPKETTYLSHEEMQSEIHKPSTNWTGAGTDTHDSLGTVFLEILECEGLPNMDAGGALGNKTDAFVCAIYEESLVQTDVIDDRLSPMWMPWAQRSFCFHMKQPLSQLFISVNDFDLGPSAHDAIGRIAVNLNHFEADVVYTLKYKIHPAANVFDREVG